VLSDRNSTQAEVDAARNALNKLIAKARLKPDKSPILNALAEARSLNMSLYTAASAKSLNALLAKADALLAAPEEKVTQSEINALATEIKGAIKDLEPKQGASVPAANDDKAATLGGNASNVGKESTVSDKLDKAEAEKAKPATAASGIQVAPSTGATSQTQTSAGQTQVPADQPATATPNDAAVIAGIPAPAASDADIVASGDVAADGIGVVVGAEAVAESKESGMPAYWLAIALIILVVCGLFGYRFGILKRQAQGRGGSKK
jgi:cobalamin biosynthesis Mg chelatase CobN